MMIDLSHETRPLLTLDSFGAVEVQGRMTEMVCSCGGKLQETRYVVTDMRSRCPTHRKKRIRKKLEKRWLKETKHLRIVGAIVGAMQPPRFKCVECGRTQSFYSAVGNNLIKVEPLPTTESEA